MNENVGYGPEKSGFELQLKKKKSCDDKQLTYLCLSLLIFKMKETGITTTYED